jgi:hypothetical protein
MAPLQTRQFAGLYTPPGRIREISEALPGEGYEHRAVVRSLASSTMPAKHLKGLGGIVTDDPVPQNEGAVSVYHREVWPEPGHDPMPPEVGLAGHFRDAGKVERGKLQFAMLHEVGHHVQAEKNEKEHFFGPNGRNEGRADNFADAFHTSRARHQSVYQDVADNAQTGSERKWARSYNAARNRKAIS